MYSEVIFDLETKKFFDEITSLDPAELGVSIVSLYHRTLDKTFREITGQMVSFWENDFGKMWELFTRADRVVGFNSKRFDVPALKPYSPLNFAKLTHFDILEEIKKASGRRASLQKIATLTLGKGKVDDPRNAINYYRKGDPKSLKKLQYYCEADVVLTKDIYDFVLTNKHLKFKDFWNEERIVNLDFSYPPTAEINASQSSLF